MIRLILLVSLLYSCSTQEVITQSIDMADYNGQWECTLHPKALSHQIALKKLSGNVWQVRMTNDHLFYDKEISNTSKDGLSLKLDEVINIIGSFRGNKTLGAFINSPDYKYHIELDKSANDTYTGTWNTFYVDELLPSKLYLAVEGGNGEEYQAYPLIIDNRFRGTYVGDFQKDGDKISFSDQRTGYHFKGILKEETIYMAMYLAGAKVTDLEFRKSTEEWTFGTTAKSEISNYKSPKQLNDQITAGELKNFISKSPALDQLLDSISNDALTNVHSVLVAKDGNLIYEKYFNGFHADLPHDQRSAAKSIGSAIIGMAISDGIIEGVDRSIYEYLPDHIQYTKSDKKSAITIKHLLTMSSGLDAIDFGIDRMGQATEDNYQNSDNWLKTVMEAPMIYSPGEHSNYGSANPFLLSVALSNVMDEPLLDYMDRRLFTPLGFTNYSVSLDDNGNPYFGGGFYLVPRDMLKFGELYRNRGVWNGKRILSGQWVADSFKKLDVLENSNEKNDYGYLWWHMTYNVNGQNIEAVEARGAGGQYISIIDELDMTIVITSGNYRNGRFWQPEMIIRDYILPDFIK